MKYCRRLCSLLLLFVCLFGVFSSSAIVNASSTFSLNDEDFSNGSLQVKHSQYEGTSISYNLLDYTTFSNGNSIYGNYDRGLRYIAASTDIGDRICIKFANNEKLLSKDSSISIDISNIINWVSVNNSYDFNLDTSQITRFIIYFRDSKGDFSQVDVTSFDVSNNSDETINYTLAVDKVPFDTYEIYIESHYPLSAYTGISNYTYTAGNTMVRYGGLKNGIISVNEKEYDEKVGLLQRIIQGVTNIKDGIVELPSKIASSVKGFFDNVVNGIKELGNTLLDGIKNLFVPDEEFMTSYSDEWNQLLEDRFGALYQCISIVRDYVNQFKNYASKNSIQFPTFNFSFSGTPFTFGGWEVQLVPAGFEVLFESLKLIIDIACTILVVNTLKRKYERLVEK